nr:hypothetical protein [Kibdelosporangium sp. MJ126-NF4]CEL21429.1 Phage endolysin [Kibdelosporangium sp. MJ126-NF4]CTQ96004.1 Phage endolysin [Kibdelosporangium sp. MJ126-NF4]
MTDRNLGRRSFLVGVGATGALIWSTELAVASAAPADGQIAEHLVEGSSAAVALRTGAVATVLLYVARRFHYEIAPLKAGDITGFGTTRAVTARYEANYASGTAIAVLPGMYPTGARGCLFPHEVAVVRDILAECEGTVRWAGDEPTPKEGHFQIAVAPGGAALRRVAEKLGGHQLVTT